MGEKGGIWAIEVDVKAGVGVDPEAEFEAEGGGREAVIPDTTLEPALGAEAGTAEVGGEVIGMGWASVGAPLGADIAW